MGYAQNSLGFIGALPSGAAEGGGAIFGDRFSNSDQ
jgi:hypothetical protein